VRKYHALRRGNIVSSKRIGCIYIVTLINLDGSLSKEIIFDVSPNFAISSNGNETALQNKIFIYCNFHTKELNKSFISGK